MHLIFILPIQSQSVISIQGFLQPLSLWYTIFIFLCLLIICLTQKSVHFSNLQRNNQKKNIDWIFQLCHWRLHCTSDGCNRFTSISKAISYHCTLYGGIGLDIQILGLTIVPIYIISRLIFKLFVETGTFSEGKKNELQIKEDNGLRWHKCPFV